MFKLTLPKVAALVATLVLSTTQLTVGTVFANNDDGDKKVTICHATSSNTNPYVSETIAASAVVNAHIDHQDDEDIIPPFTYKGKQYSQNWNANGVAIWNNDCNVPLPTNNQPGNNNPNNEKVRICHATHSDTNPYVSIEVDRNAADGISGNSNGPNDHYGEHPGPVFDITKDKKNQPAWGDIIPALAGGHSGLNWTAAGQAIWNNNCVPFTGGMGSGPGMPTDPQTPASTPETTIPQLANTGSDIWISSLVSLGIIAASVVLGIVSRRKLTVV